jgi:hypothetical protein
VFEVWQARVKTSKSQHLPMTIVSAEMLLLVLGGLLVVLTFTFFSNRDASATDVVELTHLLSKAVAAADTKRVRFLLRRLKIHFGNRQDNADRLATAGIVPLLTAVLSAVLSTVNPDKENDEGVETAIALCGFIEVILLSSGLGLGQPRQEKKKKQAPTTSELGKTILMCRPLMSALVEICEKAPEVKWHASMMAERLLSGPVGSEHAAKHRHKRGELDDAEYEFLSGTIVTLKQLRV